MFLHIRSSPLLKYATQNHLSLLHTALVGNYISSIPANILHKKVINSPTKLSKTKIQATHNKPLALY